MRDVLSGAAVVAIICVGVFAFMFGALELKRYFGPKFEEVRREIAEESRTHVRGVSAHIVRLGLDLEATTSVAHQRALARQIISEAGRLDEADLTPAAYQILVSARNINGV